MKLCHVCLFWPWADAIAVDRAGDVHAGSCGAVHAMRSIRWRHVVITMHVSTNYLN